MGRIVLFEGAYATLDLFTEEIHKELLRREYEVMVFDVNEYQKSLMSFAQFVQKPVDMVIAYNNLGFNMELVPGQNIWEQLNIPFVNILMDHPFHYKDALDKAPKNSCILCVDRKHVDYINRFWSSLKNVYFMAHGGAYVEKGKAWSERSIDVLYAGGLSVDLVEGLKPDADKYPEFDADDLVDYATKKLIENHKLLTEDVIEEYLNERGIVLEEDRLSQVITDMRIVDSYAVSYFREKVIETLIENGISVTVYGNGWEKRKCMQNPNFCYGGLVKPSDVLELMKDSKIVLSTMTWFKDGSHDRVFHGMMAGAVCITDYSKYISEVVNDGENGFIFELDNMDKLVQDVKSILNETYDNEKIAEVGRKCAIENHMFDNRVDFILSLLSDMCR